MAYSEAKSVDEYINSLPPEKSSVIKTVRKAIIKNLPDGIAETMNWGMICYEIPLKDYPNTYNKKPLMYAALAAQKNHFAIYLTGIYMDEEKMDIIIKAFEDMLVKPNMGKSCIRFTKLNKIPLGAIVEVMSSISVSKFIKMYESSRK
jgi:hypothetical protein